MKIPMTPEGYEDVKNELLDSKKNKRPKVIEAVKTARAHGDLSENAEYHAAKELQKFTEKRIMYLERLLANANVVNPTDLSGTIVRFGATVELENEETEQKVIYKLVGADESDIKKGKIAFNSPVARALIGKNQGDFVEVKTPKGISGYEILKVEYK